MSLPWSAEQRHWLEAMGHQVLYVAEQEAATAQQAGAMEEAAALLKQGGTARAQPARPAAPARRPEATSDRLLQAILRAAARSAGDDAVSALVPDPSSLRGNPAAKRALWPRLRRLRRPQERG